MHHIQSFVAWLDEIIHVLNAKMLAVTIMIWVRDYPY